MRYIKDSACAMNAINVTEDVSVNPIQAALTQSVNLNAFAHALEQGKNFAFYRIRKVHVKIHPPSLDLTTFTGDVQIRWESFLCTPDSTPTGPQSVDWDYQRATNPTYRNKILCNGTYAKGISFSFRPVAQVTSFGSDPLMYPQWKISPWMRTTDYTALHHGYTFRITVISNAVIPSSAPLNYSLGRTTTCSFVFKGDKQGLGTDALA